MKKLVFSILLLLSCILYLPAGEWQEAEQLYRDGRFAAALGSYENLLQVYPNNPFLYYNIGNCYFKMGSKGLATANYYRAFRLNPRDADIRHNLQLALQSSSERFIPEGVPEIVHKAFFSLTLPELKGLLFGLFWLFCLLGSFWAIKRKGGKCIVASFVILTLCAGWYYCRTQLHQLPLAVVAAPVAELRSGPGKQFPASANIAQGHLLVLQDSRDNWREVIVRSQGIKGWIDANSIEKI